MRGRSTSHCVSRNAEGQSNPHHAIQTQNAALRTGLLALCKYRAFSSDAKRPRHRKTIEKKPEYLPQGKD
eukprot:4664700-Pleurochrysis_carterae.AAC.1